MDLVTELKKLDWSYTFKDGKKFINNDQAYNDSATFKIIRGVFRNPYDQVCELPEEIKEDGSKVSCSKKSRCKSSQYKPSFLDDPTEMPISGYTGPVFPYKSTLKPSEHVIGLKVLLHHLNNGRLINIYNPFGSPTAMEINKFQNILLPKIIVERQDFVKHIQEIWTTKLCTKLILIRENHENFVDDMWKASLEHIKSYPQKYQMVTTLPLAGNNEPVDLERIQILKTNKSVGPHLNFSNVKYPLPLFKYFEEIKFESLKRIKEVEFSVSKDSTCEELAKENLVSIVVSPECIKCLVNNLSNLKHSWNIPIVVKEYTLKDSKGAPFKHSIVYFDSPLPPQKLTEKDKNEWLYKLLLKHALIQSRNKVVPDSSPGKKCDYCKAETWVRVSNSKSDTDVENSSEQENSVGDLSDVASQTSDDEDKLVMDIDENMFSTPTTGVMTRSRASKIKSQDSSPAAPKPKVSKKEKNMTKPSTNSLMCTCEKQSKQGTNSDPSLSEDDFTYSVLRLRQSSDVNKLSKTAKKDVKILVRSKADGYFVCKEGGKGVGVVEAKLEYQMPYGYECTSAAEAANQWTMLNFVPDSNLFRGRIISDSGKLCLLEQFNSQTFNGEIAKQKSWTTTKAKSVLLDVFSVLDHIRPGQYLLSHTEKFGAFAALYISVPPEIDAGLDLNEFFHPKILTEISLENNPQWNPVDCSMPTNLNIRNEMMPSMFNPCATSFYVAKPSTNAKTNPARYLNKNRTKNKKKKKKKKIKECV